MASHGPQATRHVGSSARSPNSFGRCVPSDARMPLMIKPVCVYSAKYTPLFSHIERKALQSPSKTQQSSVPYSRASRRFRKFPPSYEHTKTFGSCPSLFASPPPIRGKKKILFPLSPYFYDLTDQSEFLRKTGYPVRPPRRNHPD